jgi:hypothetical protein
VAAGNFLYSSSKRAFLALVKALPKNLQAEAYRFIDSIVFKDELQKYVDQAELIDHGETTGLTDDDHTQYLLVNGTRALSANWDAGNYEIRSSTFESDVATGTAPFTIASTTVNTNLNADLLDGIHSSALVLRSHWLQNGFPTKADVSLSWVDGTRTLTIQPAATTFSYFLDGVLYTEDSTITETITDTEGLWVIYIDAENSMASVLNPSESQIDSVIENDCIVAFVYWDATNNDGRLMYEVHGANMAPATHHWIHYNIGAIYKSGMALGDFVIDNTGDVDTHAQFSVALGEFYDEDLEHDLSAVASTTGLEIWYLSGTAWRWATNAGFSVLTTGSGRLAFNDAGAQTEVTSGNFVLCHVFATSIVADNGTGPKYIAIQGQAQYNTVALARVGAETEINTLIYGSLPLLEIIPVGTVIFQTVSTYANAVKARTRTTSSGDNYVDWRSSGIRAKGGSISDHGALAGLADDDHVQYLRADGTRALTAAWDAGSFEIRAETFESDVATGTAPLTIASTTVVTNLNADQLDGQHAPTGTIVGTTDTQTLTNKTLQLDDEPITMTVYNGTGGALAKGDLCYVSGDQAGTPSVTLADASTAATSSKMLVVINAAIADTASGLAVVFGWVTGLSGFTAAAIQYVSITAGDFTETAPSASGEIVRIVGYAMSTTELFFNPSATYLEVA